MKTFRNLALGTLLLPAALSLHGSTFVGDRTDFRDETIYFAMTTRFYDGDPGNNTYCWDGVLNVNDPEWRGDFKGLIDKLDYIKALGFTAVWITPVVENASGLDYHGYHAINFSKVDPRYESDDCKFQDLIDAVHQRGMKLILDIVLQHTGNFGEEYLCPMFSRDYTQPLDNINKSMKLHDNTRLPANYNSLPANQQYGTRLALMKNTDGKNHDVNNYWHHYAHFGWDDPSRWWGQIAGDCVDLNTENPYVTNYLVDCYTKFIEMGVDGFRIDTAGHISRLTFNKMFIPQLAEAAEKNKDKRGGTPFFMYGEVCARSEEIIYRGENYNCSPCYYTWKENRDYAWDMDEHSWDNIVVMEGEKGNHTNANSVNKQGEDDLGHSPSILRKSDNAWLNGNDYHAPDHSQHSGLNVIDFPMHWRFSNAKNAFNAHGEDNLYNDATYNVVYVDSHDYAPNGADGQRFIGDRATWAENLSLMFTFRGIPCIYYGSEIEFRKGCPIDKGAVLALNESGRAYFGGYVEGDVTVSDFAEYSDATGNLAATLSHPLAMHIQRLNKIRAAVPALRKGQYSTAGCSGGMSFKRRYTDATTDSYVLVTISGNATFTGIPNGTYTDVVTGDTKIVTDGKLTATCSGKGNLRAYVLSTDKTKAPGKIGDDGAYLYTGKSVTPETKPYDGNQEPLDTTTKRDGTTPDPEPENPVDPSMEKGEQGAFFENTGHWGGTINAYVWTSTGTVTSSWPGEPCTYLGNNIWKWHYSGDKRIPEGAGIIFNNGSAQTSDFSWVNGGFYTLDGYDHTVEGAGEIPETPVTPDPDETKWTIYFRGDNGWNPVCAYVWDSGDGDRQILGAWPGTTMTTTDVNGVSMWTISFTASLKSPMVIFNNGNGGAGNQTADLVLTNHTVYNADGTSSIATVSSEKPLKVYAAAGNLIIESAVAMPVAVYSADGTVRLVNVHSGVNVIDTLPHGFYIVAGTKIIL